MRKFFSATLSLVLGLTFSLPTTIYAEDPRKELNEVRKKKEDVLKEIETNDKNMKQYVASIQKAQKEIASIQKNVDQVAVKLKEAKKQEKIYRDAFNERIRVLYQKGEMGYMDTLLAAHSFDEFLARYQWVRLLAKQDHALLEERKKATQEVKKQQEQLNQLIEEQQKHVQAAQKAYQQIVEDQTDKKNELEKLEKVEELHEEELIQINKKLIASGKLKFDYKGPLVKPCNCVQTSSFGMRFHPTKGTYSMHEGIDYGAPVNTPITAPADGVVVESRASSGYGWLVTVYHGHLNGQPVFTRYAHSWPYQVTVEVGQEVSKGDKITAVGNNGMSTGPHLHFEVRVGEGVRPPAKNPVNFF